MRKLFLHVGLPKTGTSAIQTSLFSNRDLLRKNGILYPDIMLKTNPPKHQRLIKAFNQSDFVELKNWLDKNKYDSIILSTEGVTNHFYDFSDQSFELFKKAISNYNLIIVFVTRDKNSWLRSYYTQAVFNPQSSRTSYYGTTLLFKDFIEIKRIHDLSSFDQFEKDIINNLRPKKLIRLNHSRNIINEFGRSLGLPSLKVDKEKINFSPPKWTVELMRQINQITSDEVERGYWKNIISLVTESKHNMLNKLSFEHTNNQKLELQLNKITPNCNDVFNLDGIEIKNIKNIIKNDRK